MKWLLRWETFALASAFFAGLTAFLGKLGVAQVNSNLATLIRVVVVLVFTVCLLSWKAQWQSPQSIGTKAWVFLVLSGLATGLSWLCYYRALQLGPVSKVAPIDKLSVVFAILLGVILLGEKLTWQLFLGGTLVTLGAVVILCL